LLGILIKKRKLLKILNRQVKVKNFNDNYAIALGFIKQSDQYASVDNSIRLQGFNRFDGALFYKINHQFKTQLNIENIFNKKYIATAHNNNNIQPGSPRAVKASIVMNF
jgi:catecholate siderophore receptor